MTKVITAVIIIRFIVGRRMGPFDRWTAEWRRRLDSIGADPFLGNKRLGRFAVHVQVSKSVGLVAGGSVLNG